ncbi:Gx transporter family protein [Treponema sp. TIM-1]|uniref:Gx transporter family protein n=1 Tax=Treponema sp. TIM-1 TaxID=2898417 RepID=UPI00397FCCE1
MRARNLTVRSGRPDGVRGSGDPATTALLGACCFFLAALEYMIPKPLPFMRIGLANMPLIAALDILSVKNFALLVFIKILGQGLITGSLFSYVFLFSLAGTLASGAVMYLLRRCLGSGRIGFVGVSTAGALLSNGVQLVLARLFIFGEGVQFIAPPFLGLGVLTGIVLGLFCEIFTARSRWYRTCRALPLGDGAHALPPPDLSDRATPLRGNSGKKTGIPGRDLLFAGFIMMGAFLFNPSTLTRGVQFLLFGIYARLTGKKIAPLFTLFIMAAIVFCNLLVPYGRVLAEFGPLRLTQGSLLSGLHKAITLEGLFFLSKAAIGSDLRFPGRFGFFIGESFRLFDRLIEQKGRITRKHFIEGIDALLVELSAEEASAAPGRTTPGSPAAAGEPKRTVPGMLLLAGGVLLTLGLTLLGLTGSALVPHSMQAE